MGIKYCKACKKPMKAADSHCRTCGAEYKNSVAVPLIILVVIVAIGGAIYALSRDDNEKQASVMPPSGQDTKTSMPPSSWEYKTDKDPITNVASHAAFAQFLDYDTKKPVEAGLTIMCNSGKDKIIMAGMSSEYPIKTDSFNSDGPMGRYTIKVDEREPMHGVARLGSHNTVIVLSDMQSGEVVPQLINAKRVIVQVSSTSDRLVNYEVSLSGTQDAINKLKSGCKIAN